MKVSLHQFYLAYSGKQSVELCSEAKVRYSHTQLDIIYVGPKEAAQCFSGLHLNGTLSLQLPVVAIDSYCPIVNPFSGSGSGHLAVLLAMGTNDQVLSLLPVATLSLDMAKSMYNVYMKVPVVLPAGYFVRFMRQ